MKNESRRGFKLSERERIQQRTQTLHLSKSIVHPARAAAAFPFPKLWVWTLAVRRQARSYAMSPGGPEVLLMSP